MAATPNVTVLHSVWGELEYHMLAKELGLPMVADAIGRITWLEQWCLSRDTDVAPRRVVDMHLGAGGAQALLDCELAVETPEGLRVRGTSEKLDAWRKYISDKRGAGHARQEGVEREGGRFKPKSSAADKSTSSPPAPREQKTSSAPPRDQQSTSKSPASLSYSESQSESQSLKTPPLSPPPGGHGRGGPKGFTDEERSAAVRTLAHITRRTGVKYQGSDAHVRLITGRLREGGVTEDDLRKVIAFCWDQTGLNWKAKITDDGGRMADHLCPETLFGPKKLHAYLDRARAWFDTHVAPRLAEEAEQQRAPPAPTPQAPVIPIPLRKA